MSQPPRFRVRCWGARGTIPSPAQHTLRYGGNTTCIEIQTAGGTRVILDAGSGIRALGAEICAEPRSESAQAPMHLFLTHRHLDHVMGLPYFAPIRSANECVIIRCGNSTPEQLQDLATTLMSPPLFVPTPTMRDVLKVLPCLARAPMEVDKGCYVHKFDARHNGGAGIFRIDDGASATIAFAPDNELFYASNDAGIQQWRSALATSLKDVALLIHDASYADSEIARFTGWGHSSAQEATRFAIECNAKSLLLFHHHPDRTDDEIDALVAACQELAISQQSALQVSAAYEGLTIEL